MKDRTPPDRPETPDDEMSREEKESLEEQIEEFEGPDRREVRGAEKKQPRDPGVSHSEASRTVDGGPPLLSSR
jgi:hypothetical protein